MYSLQFADEQVVVAGEKCDMGYMMRKLIEENKKWGLTVNL